MKSQSSRNQSFSDPGGPKHTDPTDPDPQHCTVQCTYLPIHYFTACMMVSLYMLPKNYITVVSQR
jgi:hypothetical protein